LSTSTVSELEFIRFAPASFVTNSTSLYAQDVWKITRRMTLTYGLRWELEPAPAPGSGTKAASWTNVDDPSLIALAPFGTPLWKTTYGNLAPRLGIALKPTSREDLVLRGGFGLFYDLGT
jgi:outer membrane receptor protein involved in Fe transport